MRIEAGLVDRKRHEGVGDLPRDHRSKSNKKSRRRQKKKCSPMPSLVQKLFQTCKEVFAECGPGLVPSESDVERLKSVLDSMVPEDVGLRQDMSPYFKAIDAEGAPAITYLHLYECEKFSICIFCLPPNAVIPLHNHPGMTVFSKILFGSMHIKSFDWAEAPQDIIRPPGVRLAEKKTDTVYTAPCRTSTLYPAAGGNMHRFTAVTSCAVLDVLGPPYSDPEGRHCMYYNEFPYESFSGNGESMAANGEGFAWLKEDENTPDDFFVVGAKYKGPKIVDSDEDRHASSLATTLKC